MTGISLTSTHCSYTLQVASLLIHKLSNDLVGNSCLLFFFLEFPQLCFPFFFLLGIQKVQMSTKMTTTALLVVAVLMLTGANAAVNNVKKVSAYPCPTCGPPYPWWTGVELANPQGEIRIEGFLAFTCPDCMNHWFTIIKPLIAKYGQNISYVHQPFALPYQDYSYDCSLAGYAVYRLLNNNASAYVQFADSMFNGQNIFFNAFSMSQEEVWTTTFAEWAAPLGITQENLFAAMNGTITTANYDAWYQARMCRQRTMIGAPSFVVNEWLPFELQLDQWTFADWDNWVGTALAANNMRKQQQSQKQ